MERRLKKELLGENVYHASDSRVEWAFDNFDTICVSFSGGKDSTVLFHLTAEVARKKNKKFSVLFIDWEVQFHCTIEHISKMKKLYADLISEFFWVALPLTTVNGVSQFETEWVSWGKDEQWVRNPPGDAITDYKYFPFYEYAMTFEAFIPAFSKWLSRDQTLGMLVGVRADESLTRFMALASKRKTRYSSDLPWTTAGSDALYCTIYPLYDWKARDIWIFNGVKRAAYNPLYDLMYRAGVTMKAMRVCEPFGPEQRRGLWLFHVLEPEVWARVCSRVAGANCGAIYAEQHKGFYNIRKDMSKPAHHTWRSYAHYLLDSMPHQTAEHYKNKIAVYLMWYKNHGFPMDIPDEQENDLGGKDIPSWRRICKTIMKNDFWCRTLSFSPNKPKNYGRYLERMRRKRSEWRVI